MLISTLTFLGEDSSFFSPPESSSSTSVIITTQFLDIEKNQLCFFVTKDRVLTINISHRIQCHEIIQIHVHPFVSTRLGLRARGATHYLASLPLLK